MFHRWAPIPVLAFLVAAAAAQTAVPGEPLEQLLEDVSPLAVSLREQSPELQTPNDWRRVYRKGDQMMRVQGAVQAVFPQSAYSVDREGRLRIPVPSGTVFYIGEPFALPTPSPAPSPTVWASRFENRVPPLLLGPAPEPSGVKPRTGSMPLPLAVPTSTGPAGRMVEDSEYRAQRIRSLMRFAARANQMRAEQR